VESVAESGRHRRLAERIVRARRELADPPRIGEGATVSWNYAQSRGRLAFFNALYRCVPETTHDLASAEARKIEQQRHDAFDAALDRLDALGTLHTTPDDEILKDPGCVAADAARDAFIRSWQATYNLNDEWIWDYAAATMTDAWQVWTVGGVIYDAPLSWFSEGEPGIHDGLREPEPIDLSSLRLVWHPEHTLKRVPIYLHDLEIPTHVVLDDAGMEIGEYEDDGWIGWFDRRTESVEAAAKKIIDEFIRPRLIGALNGKVRDDLEFNEAILPPKPMKTPSAYEWTVRYQVLGESRNKIAASVERDRTHVGREIDRVADLVGLTLRPERGGRPAKSE